MKQSILAILGIVTALGTLAVGAVADIPADAPVRTVKPIIVLVHGAWADGSSWQRVIPLLQRDGYTVIAVQNTLTSLTDDVATTKRVLDAQTVPVVLVGHSYGGVVITQAAANDTHVKSLVYISAYAPGAGESVGTLNSTFPSTPVATSLVVDAAGFLTIDPAKFRAVFCADLPGREADVLAAAQKPVFNACFGQPVTVAAWKTLPSWYFVSQDDHVINPQLERSMARRMGAHTIESDSSHASLLSHPQAVADLIEQAAEAGNKGETK